MSSETRLFRALGAPLLTDAFSVPRSLSSGENCVCDQLSSQGSRHERYPCLAESVPFFLANIRCFPIAHVLMGRQFAATSACTSLTSISAAAPFTLQMGEIPAKWEMGIHVERDPRRGCGAVDPSTQLSKHLSNEAA